MNAIRTCLVAAALAQALVVRAQPHPQAVAGPAPTDTVGTKLRGFSSPVYGRWLTSSAARSGVPLGGLGTGFVEIRPDARIHDTVTRNNWTSPRPPASCSLSLAFPGSAAATVDLIASASDRTAKNPAQSMRYFGHYPMADIEYGRPVPGKPVTVSLRAFSPFIPRDGDASNLPVAIFAADLKNEGASRQRVALTLRWANDLGAADRAAGNVDGLLGWTRPLLPPRARWLVSCAHVLGASDAEVAGRIRAAVRTLPRDPAEVARLCTSDDRRLALGRTSFELDDWGGFNWEAVGHETATIGAAPSLGQILYALRWGEKTAGLAFVSGAPNRADGLKLVTPLHTDAGHRLAYAQVATDDGALLITQVCALTENGLLRWFVIENRTDRPIRGCAFAYYANADVGGTKAAEAGTARWRTYGGGACGIDFAGPQPGAHHVLAAWSPKPTHALVGVWPDTPARMRTFAWPAASALGAGPAAGEAFTRASVAGVQMRSYDGRDTEAVAAWTPGWRCSANPASGGSVSLAGTLAPGERRRLWFAIAWHAPTWRSSDGVVCMNRYAAHYLDAAAVACRALADAPDIERRIIVWQERLYAADYPAWLKDALVNGLYSFARNSLYLDDGRFFHSESFTGCPITETLVCRFNGSFATVQLFPELEKATLREFARVQTPNGQIAFGFGSPVGVATPMLDLQKPIVSSEFVLMCRRDALWTADRQFAREIYPAAKKAMQFAMTMDTDGDGLIEDAPGSDNGFPANQYYDIWPWFGTSAYTAGIGLAALRAAEEMAREQNDAEFAAWCRALYDKGAASYEEKLWNGQYYRLYNDFDHGRMSETSLANQLCGQLYAWACDAGDLLPRAHILSALRTVGQRNVQATRWGAVAGVKPDLSPDESGTSQSREVVVGETWNYAATALRAVRREQAPDLSAYAWTAAENAYKAILQSGTLWNQHFSYGARDGNPVWGSHYYSNLCIWALPFALEDRRSAP